MVKMTDPDIEAMLIERRIEQVLLRYTRAADRFDAADMRSCYWPGAVDWHGDFRGSVEEFIPWVERRLSAFDRTMHYLTNIRIEVTDSRDVARVESYVVAFHRSKDSEGKPVEMYLGLRYVDRFEVRVGEWRIAARVFLRVEAGDLRSRSRFRAVACARLPWSGRCVALDHGSRAGGSPAGLSCSGARAPGGVDHLA